MRPSFAALACLLILGVFGWLEVQHAMKTAEPWLNPVVTPQEVAALDWVRNNTEPRTVFAAGIFGGELIMGKTRRESVVGGDWAIIPNVVQRMSDVQYKLFQANESKTAWQTAKQYHAEYVWAPNRQVFAGFAWVTPAAVFEDAQYFEKVFDNGAKIYRVK